LKAKLPLETDERFRLLVESVLDCGIFILDPDGRVASWNPGAERTIGYSADEIVGHHFSRLYTPEDIAQKRPLHHLQRAQVEEQLRDQGWRVRKDGSRFWANIAITGIRNRLEKLMGFAHVVRDLALGKLAEDKLRTGSEQLRLLADKLGQCRGNVRSLQR
jgi:PAS domain S-box-containing protein